MPTKPQEAILFREFSIAEAKEDIAVASQLLRELVNYATNALARCSTSKSLSRRENEDLAVLDLYRHLIELTDGIEVLLSQSCPAAAIPLLRSSFEVSLGIEYLLENDADYVQRSLAWTIGYLHKRIDMYDRLDPSTSKGREAKKLFDRDKVVAFRSLQLTSSLSVIEKAKRKLQVVLAKPHLQLIEAEYIRQIKAQKNNNIEWYSLFDGPRSLYILADRLHRGAFYEILYRQWSTNVHGADFSLLEKDAGKENSVIRRLRDPDQIGDVANFSAIFLLDATRLILKKLRPGENLAPWYKREVQKPFHALRKKYMVDPEEAG